MVFAMAFTMMAGAAFTDSADIEATEAVDTLSALGVLNGFEDGSFQPNGTVTRAQMAAMIYIVRNGGKTDASGYANLPTSFTDISGHWAEGFIKHAQTMGIISGRSDTIFDPDAPVTGVEAALMCLRTAGYNAEKAGIGGATWASKTLSLSNEAGLLDDVATDLNAACPRQWAAQLIYNMLDTNVVKWSNDAEDFEEVANTTVGSKYMDLTTKKGIVTAVGHNTKGYTMTISTAFGGTTVASLSSLSFDPSEFVGTAVKAMYKETDKVYGVSIDSDKTMIVAEGYVADLDKVGTDAKVKLDGTEYDTTGASNNLPVYTAVGNQVASWDTLTEVKNLAALKASKIVLIDNDGDEKIDLAVVTPVAVVKIGTVDGNNIAVTKEIGPNIAEIDTDDDVVYDGIKKDDYALYVPAAYVANGNAFVTKADIVSGKVESVKSTNDILIDGTWYTLLNQANTGLLSGTADIVVLGDNAVLVDSDGGSVSLANLVYIQDAEKSSALGSKDQLKALAIKADGASSEIIVSKVESTEINESNVDDYAASGSSDICGKLYTYKISSSKYQLTEVTAAQTSYDYFAEIAKKDDPNGIVAFDGKNAVNAKKLTVKNSGTETENISLRINDDATIFVYSKKDAETKVISGTALKAWKDQTWDITGVALVDGTSGYKYIKVAAIALPDATSVPGSSSDTLYGYITSDVVTIDTDDGQKYQFTLHTGDTVTTTDTNLAKDMFISYELDGDDIDVISSKTISNDASYIADIDGDEIMIGSTTYNMKDDETQVIFVRTKSHEAATGELVKADKNTAGKYYQNVVAFDDGGELKALFVDASNKLYVNDEAVTAP